MRVCIFLFCFSLLLGVQIQLEQEILDVELADTPSKWAKGLMGRKELKEGKGMLFIYPSPRRLSFWMKNTYIPLSVAFFDDEKKLTKILDMDPPIGNTFIHYRSTSLSQYALEVPQGWFEKHGIQRGSKFSFLEKTEK